MSYFKAGKYTLKTGKKTLVMGILNVTPDSFSDGGLFDTPEKAVNRALEMQAQGADIIDIGANSTRPGAALLTAEQEAQRLEPFLAALRGRLSVPLSVDTFYPECASLALSCGANIINDVSGSLNEHTASLAKQHGAAVIVTHNPCGAGDTAHYADGAVAAVREFFLQCIELAFKYKLAPGSLCLDPGIGFGKSYEDNLELLRNTAWLKFEGYALLVAASRKRFLGEATGIEQPALRDSATVAAHTAAIAGGADIIRVHDVISGVAGARTADAVFRTEAGNG